MDNESGDCVRRRRDSTFVIEIIRTYDPVVLSFAEAVLEEAGVGSIILDRHMGVADGLQGGIVPRLMVLEGDAQQARRLLKDAGLGPELRDP